MKPNKIFLYSVIILFFIGIIKSDNWEYYKEPKKQKEKEIWYQVVYQFNETETPCLDDDLWKSLEDYYQITDTGLKDYKFEPRLINPIELEYE